MIEPICQLTGLPINDGDPVVCILTVYDPQSGMLDEPAALPIRAVYDRKNGLADIKPIKANLDHIQRLPIIHPDYPDMPAGLFKQLFKQPVYLDMGKYISTTHIHAWLYHEAVYDSLIHEIRSRNCHWHDQTVPISEKYNAIVTKAFSDACTDMAEPSHRHSVWTGTVPPMAVTNDWWAYHFTMMFAPVIQQMEPSEKKIFQRVFMHALTDMLCLSTGLSLLGMNPHSKTCRRRCFDIRLTGLINDFVRSYLNSI